MIIDDFVYVKIAPKNMKHYIDMGYKCNIGDSLLVKVEHLTHGSNAYVNVSCDFCGKIIKKQYRSVLSQREKNNIDVCYKCKTYKSIITNINKYGEPYPQKTDVVKNKIKKTKLERYGTTGFTEQTYEKLKNTNINKYGSYNVMKTDFFKNKAKESWRNKTREEIDLIISKRQESFMLNQTQKCQKQQKEIYNMLLNNGYNVELNKPEGKFSIDIALYINNIKIDIEYDGWYWHKDKQRDIKRDKVLQYNDWKVIRIRGGKLIPSIEDIKEKIDILCSTTKKFEQILLQDWREGC